jgi:undecaprenyl-diphosphatase
MNLFFILCAKYLFLIPFIIAALFFFRQPRVVKIKIVVFGLACAVISYLIALIAGHLYFDPRPFVEGHFKPLIEHDTENGFPSDHVLLVSTVAAVVTVFNKKIALLLWGFTVVIAIARVYVGVHHILDVVSSMFIAGAVTALIYYFFSKWLNFKTTDFDFNIA